MVTPGRLEPRCEVLLFVVSAAACELCACDLSAVARLALSISFHGQPLTSCSRSIRTTPLRSFFY